MLNAAADDDDDDDHHARDDHDHSHEDFMMITDHRQLIIDQAPAQSLATPAAEGKRQQRGADRWVQVAIVGGCRGRNTRCKI